MIPRRRWRTALGWLVWSLLLLLCWLVVALAVVGAVHLLDRADPAPSIDPAAVRRVCAQYADLDLSGLAPLCKAAGYQQVVQPEDLDRAGLRRPGPCRPPPPGVFFSRRPSPVGTLPPLSPQVRTVSDPRGPIAPGGPRSPAAALFLHSCPSGI